MPEVELSAGPIEYSDTGGDGPVLVLLHGLTMDGTLWRKVVPGLAGYRCILPTLPLGGHRTPMRPDADLSMPGMVQLMWEFLEKLDLRDVTLVLSDWGGAQYLISEEKADRVGRLVMVACEAFDNYPPGLPGWLIVQAARMPGGLAAVMRLLRLQAFRRAPGGWGWMSKRPVPREVMDGWFRPATDSAEIRRDIKKYGLSVPPKETLLEWADRLKAFDRPVLVVWATEDKVMPREHGRRLADLFPDAKLVEVEDSYTLIPEDRPDVLIKELREFVPA
ncbi:alpha/beta fold hydrolase [Amycolatopsis sp. GM8]|uniref:alpha/beta fold hydrolase n=1 Tax=Amycolatopsis sp. GM8 TaxID=2896530 RepID=UPI001F1AFF2F|nr:alpha/beta hydrolase [Amycolatopsis sp. GM8]